MERPRILVFSTAYFPLVGGAEVAVKEITDRLPHYDYDLVCARLKRGLSNDEKVKDEKGRETAITVHRVGIGHPIDKYLLPILGPIKAISLGRFLFVWSILASYGGFAALVYTWLRPGIKFLLTLQEGDPLEHYAKRTGWLTWLHKKIFQRADAVQAISRFLAEWAMRMGFRGQPAIVPNGVDVDRFAAITTQEQQKQLRRQWGINDEDVVLVTASRLSLKNGVDDLIRSLSYLPNHFKAVIAGDGEDREKLKTLTEELKVQDRVVFLGLCGHDMLPVIFHASNIFIRPSLSEGLGNAFLEAMAAKLPVIGTPVGGIPDFLVDGETGVFCRPRDPESIARAVQRICNEPGLSRRLIQRGGDLVREGYSWDALAERMGKMFRELTGV